MRRARDAGAEAVAELRDRLNERAADLIKTHPRFAAQAAEVGLINRDWLENPVGHPVRSATTIEIVERFLEKSIEEQPSVIATLGLNTIQLLTWSEEKQLAEGLLTHDLTVVFTDLEGFTSFTQRTGDDAAIALLERHHRAVGPVVRSRGGRIVKKLGDGLLLSFPAPEAAVLTCLELQELDHEPLRLRAGIHHGEAVTTRDDLIGHDVNLAARVADSARGGEILATGEVCSVVEDMAGVELGRIRRRRFRGLSDSVLVGSVRRAGDR